VVLLPGVILQGRTTVSKGAEIGPDTRLVDTTVGESAVVMSSTADRTQIGAEARIGPFCVLRPGTRVLDGQIVAPHTVLDADTVLDSAGPVGD
jgi:bifunctional UDP-N-acetylglucosamine pyrophosphorylase/glucosamine-1-phosphate N-acetyltransferase